MTTQLLTTNEMLALYAILAGANYASREQISDAVDDAIGECWLSLSGVINLMYRLECLGYINCDVFAHGSVPAGTPRNWYSVSGAGIAALERHKATFVAMQAAAKAGEAKRREGVIK